jgi:hypothetical protein
MFVVSKRILAFLATIAPDLLVKWSLDITGGTSNLFPAQSKSKSKSKKLNLSSLLTSELGHFSGRNSTNAKK